VAAAILDDRLRLHRFVRADVVFGRTPLHVNVRWPTAAATDCVAWRLKLTAGQAK
jgi:hypothetical protein